MAIHLDSDTLISSVKRKASVPDSQVLLTDADFLAFANEELFLSVLPTVLDLKEEHYVHPERVTIVANTSSYTIPYRSIGNKLRDLFYIDDQDNRRELTRISPDDKAHFQNTSVTSTFKAFYVEGDQVKLIPEVADSPVGELEFTYYLRPNELVATSRVAIITAIAAGASTTVYSVDGVPSGMTTSVLIDILQTKSGHKIRAFDLNATAVNASAPYSITIDNDDLLDIDGNSIGVEVGDYIAFAGECIIPQIPSELHPVLAERVAARVMEALGDEAGLKNTNNKIAEMEQKTKVLIDSRVDGAPMKVLNRSGLLYQAKRRFNGRF